MVAVQITETGVEVDALANVAVHPAAELFPLMYGAEFAELVADIAEHGQRDAVVMTPDGQLLDGRNRWRACAAAGITPVSRVESGEPWAYVISTNVHRRHLNESQRAMIGAKIAQRGQGATGHSPKGPIGQVPTQPSTDEAAALLNVGRTSIVRAREVRRTGTAALQRRVEEGTVPVYTAARIARDLAPHRQDEFAQRVTNGADPKKLAAAMETRSDRQQQPRSTGARTDNLSPKRHQHLGVPALRSLRDSLDALDLVLRSTPDGIDPSVTASEAARWWDDLAKGRGAIRRVMNLLAERKESTE